MQCFSWLMIRNAAHSHTRKDCIIFIVGARGISLDFRNEYPILNFRSVRFSSSFNRQYAPATLRYWSTSRYTHGRDRAFNIMSGGRVAALVAAMHTNDRKLELCERIIRRKNRIEKMNDDAVATPRHCCWQMQGDAISNDIGNKGNFFLAAQ